MESLERIFIGAGSFVTGMTMAIAMNSCINNKPMIYAFCVFEMIVTIAFCFSAAQTKTKTKSIPKKRRTKR